MKINSLNYAFAFVFFGLFYSSFTFAQNQLFISETGNDNNSGTIQQPLATLIGARDKARQTGAKNIFIRGGRYYFDQTCFLGSQDSGITFSGYNDELVIFDGSKFIDPKGFKTVTNPSVLSRLNPKASGNVKALKITDPDLIKVLEKSTAQISVNDQMKTLARFPNIGYGHIAKNGLNTGVETPNTKGTFRNPKGAKFKMVESINGSKWSEELRTNKRAQIKGYLSADWLKETNQIHSVSASGEIRFVNGTRYGLAKRVDAIMRFFIYNLLYELDEPGEWFFDTTDNTLYVWFDESIDNNTTIGAWAGPQLFEIRDARNITIQKMTIQNLGKQEGGGKGAVNIIGSSEDILVAGVRFRFIAEHMTAFNIWHDVKNSSILSCDIYDGGGSRLYGGKRTSTSVTYGNNKIENCHFTQIFSKDFYGKACGMTGAGNIFRNNLIHNINGQPVTHQGVDHLIERNELFNVGIEEGDGGAIYTGGDMSSYGNSVKHNFIHHIMSVPGVFGRAGVYADDRDGGEGIQENVFYKGGMFSVLVNGGNGHWIQNNVVLRGFIGMRTNSGGGEAQYKLAMSYINNDPNNRVKANYFGNMLRAVGIPNWQNGLNENNWIDRIEPYWKERYPYFDFSMKALFKNKATRPYQSRFYNNMFFASTNKNYNLATGAAERDTRQINESMFVNSGNMNYKFKEPRPSYAPNIPFQNIGLYKDKYRCAVPNKDIYRRNIKLRFEGQDCHSNSDKYNYSTINSRLYYNTGEMVYNTVPCVNTLPETAQAEAYKFDFGTTSSNVFNDYTRVSNNTKGINFGWSNTNGIRSVDRGGNGTNDINRDFIYSNSNKLFEARVTNGNWQVLITFGDKDYPHDNMAVNAEGISKLTGVTTNVGQFLNQDFEVEVTDGKLSLEFLDQGGSDPNWVVTRVLLTKANDVVPAPITTPPVAENSNAFFVVNRQTGKKLAPENNNDGARLVQVDASNNSNIAKWTQVDTRPGFFYLKNVATGKYFRPATAQEGSIIEQRPTSYGGSWTQWEKINTSGGYFYLKNLNTKNYFRPEGITNNSPMQQRPTTYSGNYTQWKFEATSAKSISFDLGIVIKTNPISNGNLELSGADNTSYSISSIAGKVISKGIVIGNSIDVSSLASGIYIVQFEKDERLQIEKIVISSK